MSNIKATLSGRRIRWATVLMLVLPAGCQSYHGKPLTSEAVTRALKTPSWRELRVAAEKTGSEQLPKTMLSPSQGITPESAAVLALILNPSLRAIRDAHGEERARLKGCERCPDSAPADGKCPARTVTNAAMITIAAINILGTLMLMVRSIFQQVRTVKYAASTVST